MREGRNLYQGYGLFQYALCGWSSIRNYSISFNKWPDNIFGGAVLAGIVVVAKDITWDVTSGSLLGIAIGESVILGH